MEKRLAELEERVSRLEAAAGTTAEPSYSIERIVGKVKKGLIYPHSKGDKLPK